MDFRDVTSLALADYERALRRAVQDLTPLELRWQPSPTANHILWLVWHIARMEDMWGSYLSGEPHIWQSDGWSTRIGIDTDRNGYGDTPEDLAGFPDVRLEEVESYRVAARERLVSLIDGLTREDLGKSYPERMPRRAPTVAWVLGRVVVENSQHVGQAAFIRGLLRGPAPARVRSA